MAAFEQRCQGVQQHFWAIQRIHVQFAGVLSQVPVGIKDHGRDSAFLRFRAQGAAFARLHGLPDYKCTDVAALQDFDCCLKRCDWDHPVACVRQNGVPQWGHQPLSRYGKDRRSHM